MILYLDVTNNIPNFSLEKRHNVIIKTIWEKETQKNTTNHVVKRLVSNDFELAIIYYFQQIEVNIWRNVVHHIR